MIFLQTFILFGVTALTVGLFITKDECPPNEEYLLCGSACPFNCTDPVGPVVCSEDCVEGCFCKTGYLRNDNGTCVNADQCIGDKNPVCTDNEEFLSCGTACPGTCSQPDPVVCGVACSMGCFCKSGYVRDESTNTCVTLDKCPPVKSNRRGLLIKIVQESFPKFEQCFNQNEVYDICNANCEPSCADPEPICTKLCQGGCVCASGLLRGDDGGCISVDKCPKSNSTDPGVLGKYLNVINRIINLSAINP